MHNLLTDMKTVSRTFYYYSSWYNRINPWCHNLNGTLQCFSTSGPWTASGLHIIVAIIFNLP